jgi:PAS domain S-box-containing protein
MPKILAIDDINDNLVSLKAIVDDAYPSSILFTALDGAKGIELAIETNPDVILLDIMMPGMDGFEVCRLLKLDERVRDIPVVFLTDLKGDKEKQIRALEVGAEGFLSKPIDEIELIVQINAMVKIKAVSEQKRNEKEQLKKLVEERTTELVQSQADLKNIFKTLQDTYFQADLSGKFGLVSPSALKMYGYRSVDELLGQPAEILYFNPKEWHSLISILRTEGQIKDYVSQGRKRDGSTFWVSMNIQWLWSKDRQIIGTEGMVRDITERIINERVLKESEEKYRLMVDLLPEAVVIHEGGEFVFANATALKTVGADSFDELTERPLKEYVHPDFREVSLSRIREIYSTGQPSKFSEEKLVTLKDKVIDVEVISIPVMYLGNPAIQTIIRDISSTKLAEQALQTSEAQFCEFFEKAADAIFIAEIESGIIVDANESASQLMLRPHNDLVGIHQSMLHPQARKNYTNDSFNRHKELAKNKLKSNAIENRVVRADGVEVPVEILASEVDYRGKHCLMGTFRDITDRKQASEALKNSLSLTEATLEAIHNGILVVDLDGRVIKTSSRLTEMWSMPENILASGDDNALLNSMLEQLSDPDGFVVRVKEINAKPEAESTDLINLKDGRVFECISKPMLIEGKPQGRVWSFLDISERMRGEEALKESRSLYYSLIEQLPNPVFRKDREGRFILVNTQFCKMKGMTSEHFIGFTASEVAANEMAAQGKQGPATKYFAQGEDTHKRILQTGKIIETEEEYSFNDGHRRYFQVLRMPVVDSSNNITGTQGIMFDITEIKLAEEARKASYEFNQSLLKTIPFGMNIVDEHGNILFQNENFETVFGKNAIGGKCWEFYCDDKKPCRDCPLQRGIEVGETAAYETAGVFGGRTFEVSHTGMMFKGKKAMLEIFQDITEQKKAEQDLRESQHLFKSLFNASPDAILLMDTNHPTISWPIVDCNEAACRMNGYTREEMIGQSIDLLHVTKGTPAEREAYYNDLKKEGILRRENIHRHKDGYSFPIESSTAIVSAGRNEMVLGIDRDITDRKQAEEELIEKNTFIQTILDNLPIGVALNSIDNGIALYMNKKFEEIYGWPSDEIKGTSDFFHNVYPDENYRNELISVIMADIQSGDPQRMHWENVFVTHKDGSKRVVNAVNIPLMEQDTMVSTVSDITELHKSQIDLIAAKEKAEESDRLKSAFLANMSHEIRTPLNSIIGFSDLLSDPEFDEKQKISFAENINISGNGLLAIINDIMDISKIETGQIQVTKSKFCINRLICDIQREYAFRTSKKGIDLRIDLSNPEEELFIENDRNKLRQVLVNFVSNALKFTESGFIEIGIRDQGDHVYFQVKDTGIGIPEEYHGKVFERFRQVESPDSRKYGGNGLGLAISKSLVEILGGKIGLESVQGKGSTFYFTIPK